MRALITYPSRLMCVLLFAPTVAGVATPAMAEAISLGRFAIGTALSVPTGIASGPDGNLWFTLTMAGRIGRITPLGQITEFPLPTSGADPFGIVAGTDGNLWYTEVAGNRIGRLTTGGVATEFPLPTPGSGPRLLAAGPDGNVWFTETDVNKIGRITPSGVITEFAIPTPNSRPFGITTGPDGNLWFTEFSADKIGRITPAGVISEFPLPAGARHFPYDITAGPDGNLWFIEFITPDAVGTVSLPALGSITPSGVITEFPIDTLVSALSRIVTGPDGALWFTTLNYLGRMTPTGQFTLFPHPALGGDLLGITVGPDGHLWFVERDGNAVGRFRLTSALGVSPPTGVYVATQRFDPTLIVAPGLSIMGGSATVNGVDVTASLMNCTAGTVPAGGATLRCQGVTGGTFGPGTHAFGVVLALADGSNLIAGATWEVLANHEP